MKKFITTLKLEEYVLKFVNAKILFTIFISDLISERSFALFY